MLHELRTPVTALTLQQKLLELDGATTSSPAVAAGFRAMTRSVARLVHVADTLLEWARVDSGRFRLRRAELDFVNVAEAAIAASRSIVAARNRALLLDHGGRRHPGYHDAALIELLVTELIHRATALGEAGPITVALRRDDRAQVFAVHTRGVPRSDRTPGSADELSVADDLARAAGGDLRVRSGADAGTVFELRLAD